MKKSLLVFAWMLFSVFAAGNIRASVIYTPMNVTSNQTSTWNWFAFGVDADGFGLWVNVGSALRLETYTGPVIGVDDGGKVYLTALEYGSEIGAASAWLSPASPSYINDATHAGLNGKTVYVGVQLITAEAAVHYGWMKLVVSEDGLSVTLTGMAYQDQPGEPLMAGVIDRQVYYASTAFMEDLATNDGTIGAPVTINLEGVEFSVASGAMAQGTHYTVDNLPAGLAMEIAVTDSKNAVISLTGKATDHAESDAVAALVITFQDAAFAGAAAAEVIDAAKSDLMIKFFDPYKIVYDDLTDLVCETGGWAPFSNAWYGNEFGLWHDGTDMRIETYGKSILGSFVAGRSYFTPVDEGTEIGPGSAWVATGNWPDEPYIGTSTFTTWYGKHKYAGIQLVVGEAVLYGWLNLELSADGTKLTLYDWAFNTQPNGPIKAGQMTSGIAPLEGAGNRLEIYPNPVEGELTLSLALQLKEAADLEILDLTGRAVQQQKLPANGSLQYRINTEQLKPGTYLVRVRSTEINYTGKIVRR